MTIYLTLATHFGTWHLLTDMKLHAIFVAVAVCFAITGEAAVTTTKNPSTPPPENQSYKVCSDTSSTSASGSVQPLAGLTPSTTAPKTCNFNINAPVGQQVQLTCSAVSLSTLKLSQAGFSPVFNDVIDIFQPGDYIVPNRFEGAFVISSMTWLPSVNRLTASGSRADLLVRYYKTDQLNCQWKSITPLSTTTSDANLCLRGPSTNSNGTIQQLSNLPLSAGQTKWCLFSIIVPADKKVQVSCSVVNLVSDYSYLMFDGVTEVPTPSTGLLPTLNRIYTSIKNRIDVATSYITGDEFTCNWKTVTISATTPFTLCLQGETTVAGSIKSNTVAAALSRACRFNIKAPSGKRVQINCPTVNSPDNMLLQYDAFGNNNTLASPMVAQTSYTSNSNEIVLFAVLNSVMLNCTWTFV
ncbi:hypothetical protein DAPPUDRAFT_303929 [Daphnia pulex]|uniref:CUB domain-containing protein n=1 Tax=Daphnia pulex TaxID=6669 RepID=E9GIH6_DAPPU|nr:hypothetical protein DAPPUDRAFT_303929 [Daphnia pulex]|eukprot:EFX80761.1 hypothetical protein DAPPUDRAFT_303929 [Daphnia pulex]